MKNHRVALKVREINSKSLSDKIYEQLKQEILTMKLRPGEPLIETDIAQVFETSRTPVRAALQRLQAEKLITAYPGRGARVSEVSVSDLLEALEVREQLEPYMARKAASQVTNELKIRIKETLDALPATQKEPVDLMERIGFDTQLHNLILEVAGNKTMQSIVREMHVRFRRTYPILGRYEETAQEHKRILEAIMNGDEEEAEVQMRNHLSAFRKRILR